jgi:hypothetical protein
MASAGRNRIRTHVSALLAATRRVYAGALLAVLFPASLAFCLFISHKPDFINIQMKADSLLAVSFIWDLFHHEHALIGFQLPRIPSIFPDLVMQAAAVAVSPSYRWSVFVYGWMQLALFVLTAAWIAALLAARPYREVVRISAIVIAAVIVVDSSLPGGTGATFYYFLSCTHFGSFLAALLASAVAFKLLREEGHAWAILLFFIATIGLLSNRLLLVAFAVPVSLAALLVSGRTRKMGRVIAIIAASAIAAHLLDSQINRQPNLAMAWRQSGTRLQLFFTETSAFVYDHIWVVAHACSFPWPSSAPIFCRWPATPEPFSAGRCGRKEKWPRRTFA